MAYLLLSRQFNVPAIKRGDLILWKPKAWFGRVIREDRRRPGVLRVKFFGDRRRFVEVDPSEVEFNPRAET